MSAHYLVTGAAGFVGYHLAERLLREGARVTGFDNLNDYYDPSLKESRLAQLRRHAHFRFVKGDLADRAAVEALFAEGPYDVVVHLAAQAGVRYSITHPHSYVESNMAGFTHVLEGCRHAKTPHLVFASSSSVRGMRAGEGAGGAERQDLRPLKRALSGQGASSSSGGSSAFR